MAFPEDLDGANLRGLPCQVLDLVEDIQVLLKLKMISMLLHHIISTSSVYLVKGTPLPQQLPPAAPVVAEDVGVGAYVHEYVRAYAHGIRERSRPSEASPLTIDENILIITHRENTTVYNQIELYN